MSTKEQHIANPNSPWNKAMNDEPVFVLRASEWKYVLALCGTTKLAHAMESLFDSAIEMRDYSRINDDIPF